MPSQPPPAVQFHSTIAEAFHRRYQQSADFKERYTVWTQLLDRYVKPGDSVLDAGCGPGVFSFYLASHGHRVVGIDGSEEMIQLCQNIKSESNSVAATFQQGYLPLQNQLADHPFEIVIASSVLEYVPALNGTIASLHKQLKAGGYFLFSLPNRPSLYRKFEQIVFRLTGKPIYLRYVHHHRSAASIRELLRAEKLQSIEVHYYGGNATFFRLLKFVLPEKWVCPLFVTVCRKI